MAHFIRLAIALLLFTTFANPQTQSADERVENWKGKTVMVFTPHPDDDLFGCGGTLALLARNQNKIIIVIYTNDNKGSFDLEMTSERLARIRKAVRARGHFPNEQAARASNNGALPPDLSMIVKARVGGANYIYSILTGYGQQPPAGLTVGSGRFFNPYFRGGQISMPPPLNPDSVMYADGTMATVEQEAHDVATFLAWAADPKMEERKETGLNVMIFLIVLASLLYFSYQRVWYGQH